MTRIRLTIVSVIAAILVACGGDAPFTPEPPEPPKPPEPPRPTIVEIIQGNGQAGFVNTELQRAVGLRIRDQYGDDLPGVVVRFRPGAGFGTVNPDSIRTDRRGLGSTRWRLGPQVGAQRLEIIISGREEGETVTATAFQMEPRDALTIVGSPPGQVGLLASGRSIIGQVEDFQVIAEDSPATIGDFRAAGDGDRSELVVMGPQLTPMLIMDPWTEGDDAPTVELRDPISVPTTFWVLQAPLAETTARIQSDLAYTRGVFASEGLGLLLDDVEIIDATTDPQAQALLEFDCSKRVDAETGIGHRDDRLNFYYVGVVDGGTDRGVTCPIGDNFVAMASRANQDLLSHEMGHMLGLSHINQFDDFDQTNVMHSASRVRMFLTEGQIFRAHWGIRSVLSRLLPDAHPADQIRICTTQRDPSTCAAVQTRVFEDVAVVVAQAQPLVPLSVLDELLLERCSTGESGAPLDEVDPEDLVAVYRSGPSAALESRLERWPRGVVEADRSVREAALRLIALSGWSGARALLEEALADEPEAFGDVARWGLGRL